MGNTGRTFLFPFPPYILFFKLSILHVPQIQSACGNALSGVGPAARLYDATETIHADPSTAHLDESTNHGTNHVAKEAVGGYGEAPATIFHFIPMSLIKITKGGFRVCVALAECGEVIIVQQLASRIVHGIEVEWIVHFG